MPGSLAASASAVGTIRTIWRWRKRGWLRYEGSQPGARKWRPIGINRRKSPSPSVGARAVERRGEGLYGRPPSLPMLPECVISPGDVANVMAAYVLLLLLGFSRHTTVKAKVRSRSTSPIGPPYRSCLFFPRAHTPLCRYMWIIQTAIVISTTATPIRNRLYQ